MEFTYNDRRPAAVAVDLVNTLGSTSGREHLDSAAALRRFLSDHDLPAPAIVDEGDVEQVRALRDRLRSVFETPAEEERARLLNGLLAEVSATPQLTDHSGGWHVHYVPAGTSPATLVAAVAAMGLAAVIAQSGHERLGLCAADGCRDAFVDTSKNRSRRYCNDLCSSRTNVAAYRARNRHK